MKNRSKPSSDIIVIGTSTGGVQALIQLLADLPADLPAAVFIVMHLAPEAKSLLPEILRRKCALTVNGHIQQTKIKPGHVYIASPDRHLCIKSGLVYQSNEPRENGHRPAIDVLFRTAAQAYGSRVIGVVLTGYLDDGTAGLYEIKERGGIAVVQEPREAEAPSMPESALRNVKVDHCVPLKRMPGVLECLVKSPARKKFMKPIVRTPAPEHSIDNMLERLGLPSAFTCPECNGPLWEVRKGNLVQFQCHVGHTYSPLSLLADHDESMERFIWSSVRILNEHVSLLRRIAAQNQPPDMARKLIQKADKLETRASAMLKLVEKK